jgi:hypothetical protein
MNHTEGPATLDAIVADGNDLAAFADEGHMGVIAPVFAGVPLLIRKNRLLYITLYPAGQGLCRRDIADGHCVCVS